MERMAVSRKNHPTFAQQSKSHLHLLLLGDPMEHYPPFLAPHPTCSTIPQKNQNAPDLFKSLFNSLATAGEGLEGSICTLRVSEAREREQRRETTTARRPLRHDLPNTALLDKLGIDSSRRPRSSWQPKEAKQGLIGMTIYNAAPQGFSSDDIMKADVWRLKLEVWFLQLLPDSRRHAMMLCNICSSVSQCQLPNGEESPLVVNHASPLSKE